MAWNINDSRRESYEEAGGLPGQRVVLVRWDSWKEPVANLAALPGSGNTLGDVRQTLDDWVLYRWDWASWIAYVTGGGGSSTFIQRYVFSEEDSGIWAYENMPSVWLYVAAALQTVTVATTTTPTACTEFVSKSGYPNMNIVASGTVFSVHTKTQKASWSDGYYVYAEIYKRSIGGVETLIATTANSETSSVNTAVEYDLEATVATTTAMDSTDRLVVKPFLVMASGSANIDFLYDGNSLARLDIAWVIVDPSSYVPYTGAANGVDLGNNVLQATGITSRGYLDGGTPGSDTFRIDSGATPGDVDFTAGGPLADTNINFVPQGAGRMKEAGVNVVNETATQTLSNKRITRRVGTVVSSATPTINTDSVDIFTITALAVAITSFTTNLSGTPTSGQSLIIRIKDDGTARALAWGASFASRGVTLPTTTVLGKHLYVGFVWNEVASTWDCIASAQEA